MAQGRRVRRVVRKIDTWSVLKVATLFFTTFTFVLVLAGVLLWIGGSAIGAIDSVEGFMEGIGFRDFTFEGTQLLRGVIALGLVMVMLGTGFAVLMAVVYNLITDVVGGIQLVVLEEEPVRAAAAPAQNGSAAEPRVEAARPFTPAATTPVDPARAS